MNTISTTGRAAAPKQKQIPETISNQLLDYTRHLLDRYGPGNLPIVERDLAIKCKELMRNYERSLRAAKAKQLKRQSRTLNRKTGMLSICPKPLPLYAGHKLSFFYFITKNKN